MLRQKWMRKSKILNIRWQKSILGVNKCVPMQRGARFSSKRGSLEEGSWDAFLAYRFKIKFSGTSNNPLQAAYNFEQNGCGQKRGSVGYPPGTHFRPIAQKAIFPDPHIIHFKPLTVLNETVSSKRGSVGRTPGKIVLPYRSKNIFAGPSYNPLKPITVLNKTVSSKRGSVGRIPGKIVFALSFQKHFCRTLI